VTLPNLLIAGFPKAGTGSLFSYLTQHPDVCGATRKEVGFFTPEHPDGMRASLEHYASFFPCAGAAYATEATPRYAYGGPTTIAAIRRSLPGVRIVLILREPFDRLWSAFTFQRSLGNIGNESFESYVQACERARRQHPDIHAQGHHKGLSIGMYGEHVPPWLDSFGPHVRVVFFDDLQDDPEQLTRGVVRWLELDPAELAHVSFDRMNPTVHPRSVAAARLAARVRVAAKRIVPASGRAAALRAYRRINASHPPPRPNPDLIGRVRERYRPSNRDLAHALMRAGFDSLPPWLASDDGSS
jgi:hypothetical protein